MRPLPPRSVTSEASALSELPPGRSLEDASLHLLSQHSHGLSLRHSGEPISARRDAQIADAASGLAARLQGDGEQSSADGSSREATRHGQQLNAWVENDAERWGRMLRGCSLHVYVYLGALSSKTALHDECSVTMGSCVRT